MQTMADSIWLANYSSEPASHGGAKFSFDRSVSHTPLT